MIYLHAQSDILISLQLIQLLLRVHSRFVTLLAIQRYTVHKEDCLQNKQIGGLLRNYFSFGFFVHYFHYFYYYILTKDILYFASVFSWINILFLGGVWEIDKLMIWIKSIFIEWMIYAAETWANSLNFGRKTHKTSQRIKMFETMCA